MLSTLPSLKGLSKIMIVILTVGAELSVVFSYLSRQAMGFQQTDACKLLSQILFLFCFVLFLFVLFCFVSLLCIFNDTSIIISYSNGD